jgi:hypothetical protein
MVTNTRLYLLIGVPVFAVMMSFVGNMIQFKALEARFDALIGKLDKGLDLR